jgi:hypothetical protein
LFGEGRRTVEASWDNCRAGFAFDGALVDLLVPGTGPAEGEAFWTALRSGPFDLRGYRDGAPWSLPETAAEVFAEGEVAAVTVSVVARPVTANCHFFSANLKLDIDPREVVSEEAFESVLAVMRFVAAAVKRQVFAVAEGGTPDHAFLRVTTEGHAEFLPRGSIKRAEQGPAADRPRE